MSPSIARGKQAKLSLYLSSHHSQPSSMKKKINVQEYMKGTKKSNPNPRISQNSENTRQGSRGAQTHNAMGES